MRLIWVLMIILAGSLTGYLFTRFERSPPLIQTRTTPIHLGTKGSHEFFVFDDGTGIESVRVYLRKGDLVLELLNETYAGNLFTGAEVNIQRHVQINLSPEEIELPDGGARLVIEARDYSWFGNQAEVGIPLFIDTKPPPISLETGLTYVRRGGAEAVVYRVDEENVRHGVELGDYFFPGFRHPDDSKRSVAFYVFPPHTQPGQGPVVVATDRARNRSEVRVPIEVIELLVEKRWWVVFDGNVCSKLRRDALERLRRRCGNLILHIKHRPAQCVVLLVANVRVGIPDVIVDLLAACFPAAIQAH